MSTDASSINTFVADDFDRLAHRRTDCAWLEAQLHDEATVFLAVWKHRTPCHGGNRLRLASRAELGALDEFHPVLLGKFNGKICFAVDAGVDDLPPKAMKNWEFHGLRSIGMALDSQEAALVAYAQAMVFWHRNHRYCGRCGTATDNKEAGHSLSCSDASCHFRTFPRSDPAVIVLASRGDRILLGRQASWPAGRYSTIAGFVEPGEGLESAVRREVLEETGHLAADVTYYSSQPWPFPSSLMLGFMAQVSETAVAEKDDELEDIQWFSREDIKERTVHGPTLLPPPVSIAYRLIEHWYDQDSEQPLNTLINSTE